MQHQITKLLILPLLFSTLFVSDAMAACGSVPVYCVTAKPCANNPARTEFTVQTEELMQLPTSYKLGNASPLCQVNPAQLELAYLKSRCEGKYGVGNVAGASSFTGGDPVNPADSNNHNMWSGLYAKYIGVTNWDVRSTCLGPSPDELKAQDEAGAAAAAATPVYLPPVLW